MRKKSILAATLILLAVLSSPLSLAFKSISAKSELTMISTSSSTDVSGRISTNTTWTLAGSPYIVVGDVIVETDIFLTIEPGVTVKFTSGTNLIIDGALIAQGNSIYPITFTSNATTPRQGDWGTIRFRDTSIDEACIIAWAIVEYASAGVTIYNSSPEISNSTLQFNAFGFKSEYGYPISNAARIYNSVIFNNTYGVSGSFGYYYYYPRSEIIHSLISNNTYGIQSSGDLTIQESTISNNTYGTWSDSLKILGSNITHNTHGVVANSATLSKSIISENNGKGLSPKWYQMSPGYPPWYEQGSFSISYSSITGNKENGIISNGYGTNTVHFSNIYGNTPYDVYNLAPYDRNADVNATNNWWGTTDTAEIDQHIYDYYDDYSLRKVFYQPFLDSPVTIPPIAHDLAITNVTASPTSVSVGGTVYITVNVVNEGDFDENVTVIARYDSVQIGTWTYYGRLSAGASTTTSFYWYTMGVKRGSYTISAEAIAVAGETDIVDNAFFDGEVSVTGPLSSPYASFTYSPPSPSIGEQVTFDASNSYDPDGQIVSYIWNYGDGTTGSGKVTKHIYNASGSYSVILRVTDDDGLNGTTTQYIYVLPSMLVHDIAITNVEAFPTKVILSDPATILVTVENQGNFKETFTVTVFYDDTIAAPPQTVTDLATKASITLNFTWNTTGIPIDDYTIRAQASIVFGEGDIGDNTFVDGKITIAHRKLSVKLAGEFDYLRMETVNIRLAALVRDAETMEVVSDAAVNVKIYDAVGNLWISVLMQEKILGSGIYEWTSAGTISQLRLSKGVYLVLASASFRGGPLAYDMLEFHIDPPAEGINEALYYFAFAVVALAGATGLVLKRRQIINRFHQLNHHS